MNSVIRPRKGGVVDKARLDEQRGVVQNEKRQGENEPYGRVCVFVDVSGNRWDLLGPRS